MSLSERERRILDIVMQNNTITIAQIAKKMQLSSKTVSYSLKIIDSALKDTGTTLTRKPKIGVCITGDKKPILALLSKEDVPSNQMLWSQEERVQYLCFYILSQSGYFTTQSLADAVFTSQTTIEKDIKIIYRIFDYFNVSLERIASKGSFVNLTEQEKRKTMLDLIYYFFGKNLEIVPKDNYYLTTFQGMPKFVQEFVDISVIQKISTILQDFLQKSDIKLSDLGVQSLLLHISISIERIKDGYYLTEDKQDNYLHEVQPDVLKLIKSIEDELNITVPESEIYYIQAHLNMNGNNNSAENTNQPRHLYNQISQIVTDIFPYTDKAFLERLLSHLDMAIRRIINKLPILNTYTPDIKKNFPISFKQALLLKSKLDDSFNINIPEEEVAYIAIHIQAFKEQEAQKAPKQINVLVVCSSGKGTSQLLAARLRTAFPGIHINRILSVQELNSTKITEDIILSTIPLKIEGVPVMVVSPVLNADEIENISSFIAGYKKKKKTRDTEFTKLIDERLIFIDKLFKNKKEIIEFIGKALVKNNYAKAEIIQSALDRENISSTAFDNFAIPHGSPNFVNQSCIAYLRLAEPIMWRSTKVTHIFFICIKDENAKQLEKIYDTLLYIVDHQENKIFSKGNKKEVLHYLKEGK